jgi:hypothetical protein
MKRRGKEVKRKKDVEAGKTWQLFAKPPFPSMETMYANMSEILHLSFIRKYLRKGVAHYYNRNTNIIIIGTTRCVMDITERVVKIFILSRVLGM